MAGRRAVEGRERRKAGQQEKGCREGVSRGAAQGGQVPRDGGLVQHIAGWEWASGGVRGTGACEGAEPGLGGRRGGYAACFG